MLETTIPLPPDLSDALARLEANADLNVQVQDDLWRVVRECRALRGLLGGPLAQVLVDAEKCLKDWETEDRANYPTPLDSSMHALDDALDEFYTASGITRPGARA